MRKSAWFVILGAVVMASAVGCGDDDDIMIRPDAGDGSDAGPGGDSGPPDSGMVDGGMPACGSIGTVGGLCRANVCLGGLECIQEFREMSGAQLSSDSFEIPQAEPEDPANPETFREVEMANPANNIPVTYATGSLCTEQCDLASETNMCGTCGRCSASIGFNPLAAIGVNVRAFIQAASRTYGNDTGLCRSTCNFEIDGRGGCPDGYTCDAFTNICLESCRNDAQCNGTIVISEAGNIATWIVPDAGFTCSATTGRCEWENAATSTVGDACESQADCTADIGVCLRGGTCAETQCNRAMDTDAMTFACDGGRGVCIGLGPSTNNGALCLQGCTTSDDCNPGNACVPLDRPAGDYTGYCFGVCDTVSSGADDAIINCGNMEQCDMPEPTAMDMDPDGTCRATCDPAGATTGCEADEICEAVTDTTYGFCRPLGDFCSETDDCFGDQVCNFQQVTADLGRCLDPCMPDMCPTAGDVCVQDAASAFNGLCSTPCTAATATMVCGMGRVCQVPAGMTDGYCARMPR